jgi:hypothetical protein
VAVQAQARAAELDARVAHLVAQNRELERRVGELEAQLQARTATMAGAAGAAEEKLRLVRISVCWGPAHAGAGALGRARSAGLSL